MNGDEELLPGVLVTDFWRWAYGNLMLNSTRGLLAQFLVAKAVGDTRVSQDGWGAYDVLSEDGTKIEVKSSAYIQSWKQQRLSSITFSGLITRRWNEISGYSEPTVEADVYVFAVQTCGVLASYDPLDITSWSFYVVAGKNIAGLNQTTISLGRVRQICGEAIPWAELNEAVKFARGNS